MPGVPQVAQSTSPSGLTQKQAADKFAGLLTPPNEQEERREPATAEEVKAAPSPEDSATETVEQSADADPETQPETPVLYPVPGPDGKEIQVTLEELRGGYLRQADYTRKTQAVAELRKQEEAEATAYREQRTQYQTQLGEVKRALEALTPPEPDWATLRREQPDEYAIRRLEWNDHQERIRSVKAAEQQVAWEQAQDQQKQFQAKLVTEEEKLLQAVPEWKDQSKGRAELDKLRDLAVGLGFNPQEVATIFGDHRSILLLREVAKSRELQAKKPDAQRKIQQVKTATPGGLKTPEKDAAQKRALEQLAKSGKVKDAALAFQHRSAPRGD